jgi:hypothetical protein
MPLNKPLPPPDIQEAFTNALPTFLRQDNDASRVAERFAGSPSTIPTLSQIDNGREDAFRHDGQQIFALTLNDVVNSSGIGAATPAGWRLFAGQGQGATVLGRVSRKSRDGTKLTAVYYGNRAWEALQASLGLDSLAEIRQAEYELRVLTVPALNLEAFWLFSRSQGVEDLVVPFTPIPDQAPGGIRPDTVYTMANFLATIRPAAMLAQRNVY